MLLRIKNKKRSKYKKTFRTLLFLDDQSRPHPFVYFNFNAVVLFKQYFR